MGNQFSKSLELTKRTPRIIGREKELERLHGYLNARGERHFVYYWAEGGLGKTRLLEQLQQMVIEAGLGFYSSGIIDLYHTDTHGTSDVERAIVEGLDPNRKYFAHYRQERKRFELLRERGTDPGVLEEHRESLSEFFIQDCREMALDARKLVICFDTIELLQYESSVVEEMTGLETVDTRLRPWLLDKLAQLANVLIIFAGRPKARSPEETTDHQARLVRDMKSAFKKDLTVVELDPFTLEETEAFVKTLTNSGEVIPQQYLPLVYRLTGGRPIFLHLVVDLLQVLSPEPSTILALFDEYADLVEAAEEDERLQEARHQIENQILRGIFNEAVELGGYLSRLALMPKGFDQEVLEGVLGLPAPEAAQLLADLADLSFIKRFKVPLVVQRPSSAETSPGTGRMQIHSERTFLHDEMYKLLTSEVIPGLRIQERQVAQALITNYYNPHIAQLESEIAGQSPAERIPLRERLHKLQVERLYYLLVRDPCEGYAEYKRLSHQANRHRWVGFNMRLLDEFLRFYNITERRQLFEATCIPHEQVIRESAQMWVERFHGWGQREREIQFARRILEQPQVFLIEPQEDLAILGNICALWARAQAMRHGFEPEIVKKAQAMLERLPPLSEATPEQVLTRARLSTSIGYQFRLGGLLAQAAAYYVEANAAFRKLDGYRDELASLLNNLAYVYARQGHKNRALLLAHEALRINEETGNEYSTGLTLSALARIQRMWGNYPQAMAYGEEALDLFRELEDAHGTDLAYLHAAAAKRRLAKDNIERGWKLETAFQELEEARQFLDNALKVAREAGLEPDMPDLYAEQGRLYRLLGHIAYQLEGDARKGVTYFRQSKEYLERAFQTEASKVNKADIRQDLAEGCFLSGDDSAAQEQLQAAEDLIGPEHRIVPGQPAPKEELPNEYFRPLGKIERLRGDMAFAQEQFEAGLQHYTLAYAYFMRFSPEAVEKDKILESLYRHLRDLPVEHQQSLVEMVRRSIQQYDIGLGLDLLAGTLTDLLGV